MPGAISENALPLRSSKPTDEPGAQQGPAESADADSPVDHQSVEPPLKSAGHRWGNVTIRLTLLSLIVGLLVMSGAAINAVWFVKSRETTEGSRDRFFSVPIRNSPRRVREPREVGARRAVIVETQRH